MNFLFRCAKVLLLPYALLHALHESDDPAEFGARVRNLWKNYLKVRGA